MGLRHAIVVICVVLAAGCGDSERAGQSRTPTDAGSAPASSASSGPAGQRYPDILEVEITPAGEKTFDLTVTVSSPYDSPDRYADGWRVLAPDGSELGIHTLMHDHAGEQPFTRTQTDVEIPSDVDEVTVEGRDQRYGFGGRTVTVEVPHEAS